MTEIVERPTLVVRRARERGSNVDRYTGKHLALTAALGALWGLFVYLPVADVISRFGT